jgi:hypothetical protein
MDGAMSSQDERREDQEEAIDIAARRVIDVTGLVKATDDVLEFLQEMAEKYDHA